MPGFPLVAFLIATALYVVHALGSLAALAWRGRTNAALRWAPLGAALALHTAFLVIRGIQEGGAPTATRLDSVALFLWLTAAVFLASSRAYRLEGLARVFWPVYAAGAVAAWFLGGEALEVRSATDRLWLLLHLIPIYVGYAAFAIAAGAALGYLVQERLLRRKAGGAPWRKLPSLEGLERVGRAALTLGFPPLTLGLVAGAIWAERSSALLGHAWYVDPKVVGGIVVWLFYAAVLHVRLFTRLRGRRAALLTLAGFLLTLLSFTAAHVYRGPTRGAAAPPAPGRASGP